MNLQGQKDEESGQAEINKRVHSEVKFKEALKMSGAKTSTALHVMFDKISLILL